MAKRAATTKHAKAPVKPRIRMPAYGELVTLLDFVRHAVSRFAEAKVVHAHGTTDPLAEAIFLVSAALHLHPEQFETFATTRVTDTGERAR